MQTGEHITALAAEGAALAAAASAAGLGAAVPSCPGWRVRELLGHLGYVHRWAAGYVEAAQVERTPRLDEAAVLAATPPDHELPGWFAAGLARLIGALRAAPPGLKCWSFLPAPSPLAFWARRQAHETAIHRVDAELAAGRVPAPVSPAFAADGIGELLAFFGRPDPGEALRSAAAAVGLDPADRPESWTMRYRDGRIVAAPGLDGCAAVLRGPAAALYFALWNRQPLDAVELTGEAEWLTQWREAFRITFS